MTLVLSVLGGLAIFLLGMERMAEGFGAVGDDRVRRWIDRFTTNPFSGCLTGIVVCGIVDSSSVTIMMIIAMVQGGLLTFSQALGIVLGANIGTAIGAQIIAFDLAAYAPLLLAAGFGLHFLLPERFGRTRVVGTVVLGLGLLFFGLDHLGDAVRPLGDEPAWRERLSRLSDHPVRGAGLGAGLTALIQSSSATVGITIQLAGEGLLELRGAVAVVLGAELGTVTNTLVAATGRDRAAVRTALFHLLFNLLSVMVGLWLIDSLVALTNWLPGHSSIRRAVANAQLAFNVFGVAAVLPFVPLIARGLERALPDREGPERMEDGRPSEAPGVAPSRSTKGA